jgi:hypothetical protein
LSKDIDLLGDTIGKMGLTDPREDVAAKNKYKKSTYKNEKSSFLGLAGHERKYVPDFA